MNRINELKAKSSQALHPVSKAIYQHQHAKVLCLTFQKGMILKDHKTPYASFLLVIEGKIEYLQDGQTKVLDTYDQHTIEPHVLHKVIALEDSVCLLIQI